jgi:hypothetical protein
MHTFRFAASLRVYSQAITPSEISTQLSLKPKWQHTVGEPRMNPKGVPLGGTYDSSYCSFSLIHQGDEELHEMLDRITGELLPHKDLFCRIRNDGGRTEFFIGWYSTGNTGDTFNSTLLQKLGELQIDLAFDVYGES